MQKSRRDLALTVAALVIGTASPTDKLRGQSIDGLHHPQSQAEKRVGVVPTNDAYPPGSFLRYGADPTGATDSTAAINAALLCNLVAFDDFQGVSKYKVSGTLRFSAPGQILRGQGCGHLGLNAGTTVEYSGKPGGIVVSASNEKVNFSECAIRDLLIDGAHLANIGFSAYDDNVPGGSWRLRVQDVSLINVTSGKFATAIYLGTHAAPSFANDTIISGCYISACTRGLWGAGSWYEIDSTTFVGCSEAAVYGGTGSNNSSCAWTFVNSIFSKNGRDFDGFHTSQVSFSGCWFEASKLGIYRAADAHSCSFVGCYLHTFNTASLMDFGNAAGYHFLGGNFVPAGSMSAKIINVNPSSTGGVFGYPIELFQSNGKKVPAIVSALRPVQQGVASTVSVELKPRQSVTLPLARGTYNVALTIRNVSDSRSRTHATYTAFLFDGDNEQVRQLATSHGSRGGQPFTLECATNQVTLTYTGRNIVTVDLSGSQLAS